MRSIPLATLLLLTASVIGCQSRPAPPAADAAVGVVTIQIESEGNSPQSIQVADVADGDTLESVMRSIDELEIELSGNGATAFVHSIGDVKTDAAQGWTFKVDGEFANQGIGQTVLHPPTTVQWSYGHFEMQE